MYYVAPSGGYDQIIKKNLNSHTVATTGMSGVYITGFSFGRDYFKQSYDFTLTDIPSSWGTSAPIVSNANMVYRGLESQNATFITSKVLKPDNTNIWYQTFPNYSVFRVGSGNYVQNTTGLNTVISGNVNDTADWNSAKLRTDAFSVWQSGKVCNFDLYATKVVINCSGTYPPAQPASGNCTLYTKGKIATTKTTTCYILASGTKVAGCTLYEGGKAPSSGVRTLWIKGKVPYSGSITCYMRGITTRIATMPLYLKVLSWSPITDNCTLYEFGSTNSGIYKSRTLFLGCQPASGQYPGAMNMLIGGYGAFRKTTNMPLFLGCNRYLGNPSKVTTLFLKNEVSGINNAVTLWMQGPVGNSGSVPWSGSMNLFIARANTPTVKGCTLYTRGPANITNNTPLYLLCKPSANSGIPLYTKSYGIVTGGPTICLNGY